MADTTSSHKLQYELTTEAETRITFTIPDVREDVTAENASDVINAIIAMDVLGDEAGNPVSLGLRRIKGIHNKSRKNGRGISRRP